MRIVVFGTGGAGGYFGGCLAKAGEDVTFVARGEHLRAIRSQGLRIEAPSGEWVIQPARATDDVTQIGEVDAVLVGGESLAGGGSRARAAVDPRGNVCVVPLQNGVEAAMQLSAVLGADQCSVVCAVL